MYIFEGVEGYYRLYLEGRSIDELKNIIANRKRAESEMFLMRRWQ